jgi:hypothetical protein
VRGASKDARKRIVIAAELRESRRKCVGPIEHDTVVSVKIGDKIKLTTD